MRKETRIVKEDDHPYQIYKQRIEFKWTKLELLEIAQQQFLKDKMAMFMRLQRPKIIISMLDLFHTILLNYLLDQQLIKEEELLNQKQEMIGMMEL